ncbi:MAG: stage II sporulation protein M [Candidatus Aenigmarchaeota archaeon]|nr:stage II sporulation protein M [Candidatus Aenigmarchaeota archaeon]
MVLESLVSVKDAIRSPWHMIVFGAVISLISVGIAYFIFPENAGLMTVFLITLIAAPFMWNLLKYEEWCEEKDFVCKMNFSDKVNPIKAFIRSMMIFVIYAAFFGGMTAALTAAYIFLPASTAQQTFNDQMAQIGKVSDLVGGFSLDSTFYHILSNNLVVMGMSFILALLIGVGAIFILAWNASVLAVAISIVTKADGLSAALLRFMPHGVFEIAAFFLAAIAGGVISVAVTKRQTPQFGPVIRDMMVILALASVLVFVGAVIETEGISL